MPPKASRSPLAGLKSKVKSQKHAPAVLWQGPEAQGPLGGVTFSMLAKWLTCRERFRIRYVEGWEATRRWSHRMGYGDMWHVCEQYIDAGRVHHQGRWMEHWEEELKTFAQQQCRQFPLDQEQIVHWYNVCKVQFPVYVSHWSKHPDVTSRTPLLSEQVFDVPYTLPSGRTVRLRGKWDSVDLVTEGKNRGVWLQENKTKGDIDELAIQRQLTYDLQTMLYMVALHKSQEEGALTDVSITGPMETTPSGMKIIRNGKRTETKLPIRGVRYNVVRRPLSGGEGDIKQRQPTKGAKCTRCKGGGRVDLNGEPHPADSKVFTTICGKCYGAGRIGAKPGETDDEFYTRLRGVLDGTGLKQDGTTYTGPSHWFHRWEFDVTAADVKRFRDECLDPILEAVCNWYSLTTNSPVCGTGFFHDCLRFGHHWRHPFGCDNAVNEYGETDVDTYMATGNTVGLHRRETLFEELQ